MSKLRRSLRISACHVWRDMADAARFGLFMNEETITESILLFLARGHKHHGLNIKVYTKQEERCVGADWAWCFINGGRAVAMGSNAMTDLLPVSMPWHCMLCPHLAGVGPSHSLWSLPDVVAANLTNAVRRAGDTGDLNPILPTDPPEWVELVQAWSDRSAGITADGGIVAADRAIEDYLEEHDLSGLALFSGQLEQEH